MNKLCLFVTLFLSCGSQAMDTSQRALALVGGAALAGSGFYGANECADSVILRYKSDLHTAPPGNWNWDTEKKARVRLLKGAFAVGLLRSCSIIGGVTLGYCGLEGKMISPNLQTYGSLGALALSSTCFELAAAHHWLDSGDLKEVTKKLFMAAGALAFVGTLGLYKNK